MNVNEIASRLVELCRQGQFETAQKELFSEDAVSIEPHATPAFEKETKGLKAILEKGKKWNDMVEEMYGGNTSDAIIADNSFALVMSMDVKIKGIDRMKMTELCVYVVEEGKIISEQFFM
jgi:hypothetical protein